MIVTVLKGQNIFDVAVQYTGDQVKAFEILEDNKTTLTGSNDFPQGHQYNGDFDISYPIQPGTKLTVREDGIKKDIVKEFIEPVISE